jgi:hypothetical protein
MSFFEYLSEIQETMTISQKVNTVMDDLENVMKSINDLEEYLNGDEVRRMTGSNNIGNIGNMGANIKNVKTHVESIVKELQTMQSSLGLSTNQQVVN